MKFEEKELLAQYAKVADLEQKAGETQEKMGMLQESFEQAKAVLGRLQVDIIVEKKILEMMKPEGKKDVDPNP